MRLATVHGRLALIREDGMAADIAANTEGRFPSQPEEAFARWEELRAVVEGSAHTWTDWRSVDAAALGAPSPRPSQIFAVGVNYVAHGAETGIALPPQPMIFTKFASSITGPESVVALPTEAVDWEIELVAVISKPARNVARADAWDYVAGLTIGQDLSERTAQMAGSMPQFSLAKSHPGFTPMGPVLVTPDEFADLEDIRLRATVNGKVVQDGSTAQMIFDIPELIHRLSAVCTLQPGDVILTGTPDGVGMGMKPPVYLKAGDELVSEVEGIGTMRQVFTEAPALHEPLEAVGARA